MAYFRSALPVLVMGGFLCLSTSVFSLKIDRVIISSDAKPLYLDYWPMVAKAWTKLIGLRPTLAFIGSDEVKVDETYGDVIRFKPIPGVSVALQAQTIRLLVPTLFPDEVCMTSDVDMLPISKKFFVDSIKDVPDDHIVIHNGKPEYKQYPMCYFVAKGKLFQEILGVSDTDSIADIITQWSKIGWGWNTDELVMRRALNAWSGFKTNVTWGYTLKDRPPVRRLDRSKWHVSAKKVAQGYYTEAHMIRPYSFHKKKIDKLLVLLGLK